jgi:CheY-like chemotaxis protein
MTTSTSDPTRILLVDDDKDDCSFFEEALKETGLAATVRVINDSTRLMDHLSDGDGSLPNLIFLDLNMPNVDGKECLREIRKTENLKDTPVIIFSTACRTRDVEETFAIGANLYVQKPTGFDLLKKILKKVLQLDWKNYLQERKRNKFVFTNR